MRATKNTWKQTFQNFPWAPRFDSLTHTLSLSHTDYMLLFALRRPQWMPFRGTSSLAHTHHLDLIPYSLHSLKYRLACFLSQFSKRIQLVYTATLSVLPTSVRTNLSFPKSQSNRQQTCLQSVTWTGLVVQWVKHCLLHWHPILKHRCELLLFASEPASC